MLDTLSDDEEPNSKNFLTKSRPLEVNNTENRLNTNKIDTKLENLVNMMKKNLNESFNQMSDSTHSISNQSSLNNKINQSNIKLVICSS